MMTYTKDLDLSSIYSTQEKVISLFEFIRELNILKQKTITNVNVYPWYIAFSDIPKDDDNIKVSYCNRVEEEAEGTMSAILEVHKPEFQKCPEPDESFREWLKNGWNDYKKPATVVNELIIQKNSEEEQLSFFVEDNNEVVKFEDDADRLNAYNEWNKRREIWVEKQLVNEKTRDLFADLYNVYYDLARDSETLELIAANGFIQDRDYADINHPILTKRLVIKYDADKNNIYIEDTNTDPELYSALFQEMRDVNLEVVSDLMSEVTENDYNPLDQVETPVFFKTMIHKLSVDSQYLIQKKR